MRRAQTVLRFLAACAFVLSGTVAYAGPPQQLTLDAPRAVFVGEQCARIGMMRGLASRAAQLERSFLDDFDTFDLTSGPWSPHYAHAAAHNWQSRTLEGNEELQLYVDPLYRGRGETALGLDPHRLSGGVLSLQAEPVGPDEREALAPFAYTSGMISSHRAFEQAFGYFEIRARIPQGQGLWPAFWLLRPGQWPPEIDVMEILGHDTGTLYNSVHWVGDEGNEKSVCRVPLADATREFRLYGVLWTEEMIVHYLDRVPVSVIETKPELDAPMYMIANLGVGGKWPGSPDNTTMFPASYEIDWIAAYRLVEIE